MALGDLMGMMKQAKELQEKMQALQDEVAAMEVEGTAGGGLVSVVMTGKSEMKRLKIDPSLLKPEEAEILEDLIVAASNDARAKAEAAARRQDARDDRRPAVAARHEPAVLIARAAAGADQFAGWLLALASSGFEDRLHLPRHPSRRLLLAVDEEGRRAVDAELLRAVLRDRR